MSVYMKIENYIVAVLEWACGYLDVFFVPRKVHTRELQTRLSENKQSIKLRASTVYPP